MIVAFDIQIINENALYPYAEKIFVFSFKYRPKSKKVNCRAQTGTCRQVSAPDE